MNEQGTEVQGKGSSSANKHFGQDGKKCLQEYKIPKKTRESKYIYRDSSEDDSDTDPYEISSDEEKSESEDGEIHVSDYDQEKGHKSEMSSEVDDDSDQERFDPTDKKSELVMTGSRARYVKKYFSTYVNDYCIKDKVLADAPVPMNSSLTPPFVDDFVEDLIGSRKTMKFMRLHDNSLKYIQKKVSHIMGPLYKVWQEIDGANHGKETSEMSITEVLNLIERTVLLVGQVNVACLFERRLNFMAKILKGMKFAKETLSRNKELLTDSGDALFGDAFYNVLERKSKNRKRAREMAKEMGPDRKRKRRESSPFRAGPSGYQTSFAGRGRGKSSSDSFANKSGTKHGKPGLKKRSYTKTAQK